MNEIKTMIKTIKSQNTVKQIDGKPINDSQDEEENKTSNICMIYV